MHSLQHLIQLFQVFVVSLVALELLLQTLDDVLDFLDVLLDLDLVLALLLDHEVDLLEVDFVADVDGV